MVTNDGRIKWSVGQLFRGVEEFLGDGSDRHFLSDFSAFAFLLKSSVNGLLFLLYKFGLGDLKLKCVCVSELDIDIISDALLFTFSIANSSSALILISRAFSWASCLMNAT